MAGGRPTKYTSESLNMVRMLAKLGATNQEMAEALNVTLSTFHLWRNTHEEFSDAIKVGKDAADDRVAESLYQRAMGYSHPELDIRVIDGAIVETPVIKHYAPDTTAAIFWLKNRRPQEWRDKQEIEHTGEVSLTNRITEARKRARPEADS